MNAFKEKFEALSLPEGKIAFQGVVRVGDRGAFEFRIELNGRSPLFGEWEQFYRADRADRYANDFDVRIVSFGYGDPSNVGNPHSGARLMFSVQEKREIEKLVANIFDRELSKLRSGNRESSIFTGKNPNYSGMIIFGDDWIRLRSLIDVTYSSILRTERNQNCTRFGKWVGVELPAQNS
jgi:hypothetical protein